MEGDKFKFRTEVEIGKSENLINLNSSTFLAGSCFADMIGQKMHSNKFNCLSNPFGNIYNPTSLFTLLKYSITDTIPEEWSYLQIQGRWVNYHFHSEIFGKTKEELSEKTSTILSEAGRFLRKTDTLILTLGTAWVYKLIEQNRVVANCHKVPSQSFDKYLLSLKEMIDEYEVLSKELLKINPDVKVIFTVSPVRHTKDTLPLNCLSKSILRTAIHYINDSFPETSYFPSYELMMDDLRDYRFYKSDLIHPTELAEEYIWGEFSRSYFDQETLSFINDWGKLSKSIEHRPFFPESEEHQKFLRNTIDKLQKVSGKVDLSHEIMLLKQRLSV